MELHVCKNYDELSEHIADWMVEYICKTLATKERFSIALQAAIHQKNYMKF